MGPPSGVTGERYGSAVWSNFSVRDVPRTGLQLGSLTAPQRAAAMRLLQALLSPRGYGKVLDIMASDQALADSGTPFAAGTDVYTIGLFGTPSTTAPWMVGFGGHHLGLNVVIAGQHGVMTPTLTGAQRKQAILPSRVGDLVLGPDHPAQTIVTNNRREGHRVRLFPCRCTSISADLVKRHVQVGQDSRRDQNIGLNPELPNCGLPTCDGTQRKSPPKR